MTRTGRLTLAMRLAMVKVLPEPVTPLRTWWRAPDWSPSVSRSMAWIWSPLGTKSEVNTNGPGFINISEGVKP
jgi:hypothetical protein